MRFSRDWSSDVCSSDLVRDDKAIVGGFAKIGDQPVMIIGHQKGKNTKERQYRNFGMANPEGYRKALRLMKLAEKFNKPVVSFIEDRKSVVQGKRVERVE